MTTINNAADIMRALSENPEWKAAVRAQILGEELLQLPAQFQAYATEQHQFNDQMRESNKQQQQFNDEMRESNKQQQLFNDEMRESNRQQQHFNDEMRETNRQQQLFNDEMRETNRQQRLFNDEMRETNKQQQHFNDEMRETNKQQEQFNERMTVRMDRMGGDISQVKGSFARNRGIDAAPIIADDLGLEYVRILPRVEVVAIARALVDGGISPGDLRSFRNADLIMETKHEAETVYVAAEISFTADRRDSDRAVRNARFLAQQKGCKAQAVVISVRIDQELQELVDAGSIGWHQLEDRYLQAE